MKDAVITVRVPATTRKRIEELARQEGRSLSQQIERLIQGGLGQVGSSMGPVRRGVRSLSGVLRGGRAPTTSDFREVRSMISGSLGRRRDS